MDIIYWSVRLSSKRGGVGVKGFDGGIILLASCEYYFIRVHKNQGQYQSNNIFIRPIYRKTLLSKYLNMVKLLTNVFSKIMTMLEFKSTSFQFLLIISV